MKNSSLQQHVINLLNFEGAHVGFDQSVRGLGAELRGKKIKGFPHTAWQLLEHMRIQSQLETCFAKMARRILATVFRAG